MRKTLRLTLLACALFGGMQQAEAQMQMSVMPWGSAGVEGLTQKLSEVKKLGFANGQLSVEPYGGAAAATFSLDAVRCIRFDNVPTGIDFVGADATLRPVIKDGKVSLAALSGKRTAPLRVYSAAGQLLVSRPSWNGEAVDLTSLPAGLYILSINNQSFKLQK